MKVIYTVTKEQVRIINTRKHNGVTEYLVELPNGFQFWDNYIRLRWEEEK